MILAGSGHRPDKLPDKATGYDYNNPVYKYIKTELYKIIDELKPTKIISGMALGFDTILAQTAIELSIPFIAAIPFVGQEKIWPQSSKDTYNKLLNLAAEKVIVCEGGYAAWKMQKRNEWMTDNSDELVACWDGTNGGTKNCIDYALSMNKKIHRINPSLYSKGE